MEVYAKEKNNFVNFIVSDDGPSITDGEMDTVLMPFARLDNSRCKISAGFGLGLAIVKSCADKLDGEI